MKMLYIFYMYVNIYSRLLLMCKMHYIMAELRNIAYWKPGGVLLESSEKGVGLATAFRSPGHPLPPGRP